MIAASSLIPGEEEDQVLVEEMLFLKKLTLNRTKQLNALSSNMISHLLKPFLAYEKDNNVKLLILKGKGRAFCASGDVAAVIHNIKEGAEFFRKEYTSNFLMATYSKPQVLVPHTFFPGSLDSLRLSSLEAALFKGTLTIKIKDEWIFAAIDSLQKASPTSLKISLTSIMIREGRLQGIGQCLTREFRIACHEMRG